MSKEQGFTHIILLGAVLSVVILIIILIFLGIQASRVLKLTPDQKTQYKNPFSENSKYENPFDNYQNPFDRIKQ